MHICVQLAGISQGLEKTSAHDLKPLLGARRSPRGLDTPDHVAQAVERFAAALAAHLDIVCMRMGGVCGVRGRQADDQQTVLKGCTKMALTPL